MLSLHWLKAVTWPPPTPRELGRAVLPHDQKAALIAYPVTGRTRGWDSGLIFHK